MNPPDFREEAEKKANAYDELEGDRSRRAGFVDGFIEGARAGYERGKADQDKVARYERAEWKKDNDQLKQQLAEERETFLAEHDENVRLHTRLQEAEEALKAIQNVDWYDDTCEIAEAYFAKHKTEPCNTTSDTTLVSHAGKGRARADLKHFIEELPKKPLSNPDNT